MSAPSVRMCRRPSEDTNPEGKFRETHHLWFEAGAGDAGADGRGGRASPGRSDVQFHHDRCPRRTTDTAAYGINDTGQIVGTYFNASGSHGFLKDGSTYTTLDVPGATDTQAFGINDTGQIVGTMAMPPAVTAS